MRRNLFRCLMGGEDTWKTTNCKHVKETLKSVRLKVKAKQSGEDDGDEDNDGGGDAASHREDRIGGGIRRSAGAACNVV